MLSHLQRCLILGLCLFSSQVLAGPFYAPANANACPKLQNAWFEDIAQLETMTYYCSSGAQSPDSFGYIGAPAADGTYTVTIGTEQYTRPRYKVTVYYNGASNAGVTYLDFTGVDPLPEGAPTTCNPPDFIYEPTGECLTPQEPETCYENGQIYNPDNQQCVQSCPEGELNGVCLQLPADNQETCNSSSPDYRGSIGFGDQKQNICDSDTTCEGGSLGIVNDIQMCIPDEYGPPTCPSKTALVIDEYGFVCESLQDAPEDPVTPEEPNTDTDGDGIPDEYQRENDPTSTDKAIDRVSEGVGETNDQLENVNRQLDGMGDAIDAVNDNLNDGLGTANQTLGQIRDTLQGPEGGYDTTGLGIAPEFSATSERIRNMLATNPTIAAVTAIPTLASNNTCPVYTIPATDFWSPLSMDIHCDIFNQHRGLISAVFMVMWTLAAIFVFLRA